MAVSRSRKSSSRLVPRTLIAFPNSVSSEASLAALVLVVVPHVPLNVTARHKNNTKRTTMVLLGEAELYHINITQPAKKERQKPRYYFIV